MSIKKKKKLIPKIRIGLQSEINHVQKVNFDPPFSFPSRLPRLRMLSQRIIGTVKELSFLLKPRVPNHRPVLSNRMNAGGGTRVIKVWLKGRPGGSVS